MKKVIASILSLAFLSGLFVNHSFAEGTQPAEVTQEKSSNVQLNQPGLTAQEKAAEKLKSDLKKYNEKQQKLIQKYENMTDKEFRWDKRKKTFIKILTTFIVCGTAWTFICWLSYIIEKSYHKGFNEGHDLGYHNGHYHGKQEGIKQAETDEMENFYRGYRAGKKEGKKEGFYQGEAKARTECDKSARTKCNNVLPKTKELVTNLLAAFHPDVLSKKGKDFNDVKEIYYSLTNFYDTYLK